MKQNYINHLVFCLDSSSSMDHLRSQVITIFENQIKYLSQRSQELDQETRVSVYTFNSGVECIIYDKDVMRLPSIKEFYKPNGMTNLIGATLKSIEDLEKTATLYGSHSFLCYTVSDGCHNTGRNTPDQLKNKINSLPDHWTIAAFVPDQTAKHEAKQFGFPAENISIWSTDVKGLNEVGNIMRQATDNFMVNRAKGVKGTKNLFNFNAVSVTVIKNNLQELAVSDYQILNVNKESPIKDYVESWKITYRQGMAYYQLTKKEKIQNHKQVLVQNKLNGKMYGGSNARQLLGLPDYEVSVAPADFKDYDVFVQSTSVNRKLVPGTKLAVLN